MNLKEAYATLELSETSTQDEAKKRYRELSKKWHPDVNKSPEAESKFKRINEAYDCVKNGKGNDREMPQNYPGGSSFYRQQVIQLEHVKVELVIDFKESVLGCKKEIKYSRRGKCPTCNGEGEVRLNNGCVKCGGKGQTTFQQRGMTFISTCSQCGGRSNTEDCKSCHGDGTVSSDVSVHVSVPAGIVNGNVLRLQGMGNYAGSFMGMMEQYTDALCHIQVASDPDLSIEGHNVVSHLTVSLLEALRGCQYPVRTIFGQNTITIRPQSRNRDEVIIPHCGVGGSGNQRVILDVKYPQNTDKLIGVLIDEAV